MGVLKKHPATDKDATVSIEWKGLEECIVTFHGKVSKGAAHAATFFAMPAHYKVTILFDE